MEPQNLCHISFNLELILYYQLNLSGGYHSSKVTFTLVGGQLSDFLSLANIECKGVETGKERYHRNPF